MDESGHADAADPYEDRRKRLSPIGDVLREILGDRSMRKGVALGRLARSWARVVGDPLAGVSLPRALEDGSLVVVVETPAWAAQLSFLAEEVRAKANALLGQEDVTSVRVVVSPDVRKALRRNASRGTDDETGSDGGGGPG